MVSLHYDDNLLIQYLLGGLPEEQVEEFDKLSVVDSEFASQLGEVENDLFDAYVQGALTGQIRAQFESRYLTSPRRRENVKFAQALQSFAEAKLQAKATEPVAIIAENSHQETHKAEPESSEPAVTESVSWWRAWLNLFTVPSLKLQWGFAAAAVLMLLVGGWLVLETLGLRRQVDQIENQRVALQKHERELRRQIEQGSDDRAQLSAELKRVQEQNARLTQEKEQLHKTTPSFALFILTPGIRGGGSRDIVIQATVETVKLRLEFESDTYSSYRAELRTQVDQQLVWSRSKLKAHAKGGNKTIDLSLRASLLKPQGYLLNLKGVTPSGEIEDVRNYLFRVVKK